ncbi:hypothetical protein [Pelagibius sp.]|uniref:hypothetical protein n=1 Tax=Pelagibius sp. TaxID=1931238 RepID=UPI00263244F8|nr:hypothetical protein [Pelagibius sp.]
MSEAWDYQIRITLEDTCAAVARRDPDDPALAPLAAVLRKHDAQLKCQFDAFAGYVAEAEAEGTERYPLYAWTKATIENPAKEARYVKSFTLYVGGAEVYARDLAEALEADLRPLVGGAIVTDLSKHDTNPANNPQPPKRYR